MISSELYFILVWSLGIFCA